MSKKISPAMAADVLGCSTQAVRIGLQRGAFPFGWAIKTSSKFTYVISPKLFNEYVGKVRSKVV